MLEPYFISYLYNHSSKYPIKIKTGGRKIKSIKAKITDNPWAPHDALSTVYFHNNNIEKGTEYPWNGFLSLHKTTSTIIGGSETASPTLNRDYYETAPKRGERIYTNFDLDSEPSKDFSTSGSVPGDTYHVEKSTEEADTYIVTVPFYTRAKQLYSKTAYTGNNPYVAYERHAKVHFSIELEGLAPFEREITVKQVRRIVNPKGVYRSKDNNKTFHVQLMRQEGEESTEFKTFESEGEWKAYIIKHDNGSGITLSGTEGKSSLNENGTYNDVDGNPQTGNVIQGKTGGEIDFNINFSNDGYTGNRYAVVRVEYHNNTCYHLIFVRQGDEPDNLLPGGTKWYAENMVSKSAMASTPLEEGSLFKFGNWDYPIDAKSNKNSKEPWINVESTDFHAPGKLKIVGQSDTEWDKITSKASNGSFGDPDLSNMRVATLEDYWALRKSDDIEVGYGVMYGDDADKCATNITEAYGYDYENNSSGRGMRGCFAYNKKTGKSLFFPIGASGYGHRKQSYTASWGHPEQLNGVLRYSAGRTNYFPTPVDYPLFHDIFRRPGAIYWLNQKFPEQKADPNKGLEAIPSALGWDINYFTFDFNSIPADNIIRVHKINNADVEENYSDACFIRCVQK